MRGLLRYALLGITGVSMLMSFAHKVYADPMYDFYHSLAKVIEKNMDSPDRCVAEAEVSIKKNIVPLVEAMKRGEQMSQGRQYPADTVSEQEMQQAMESLSASKGFQALQRFMQLMNEFAMKYPEHAQKISDILEKYSMQEEQY